MLSYSEYVTRLICMVPALSATGPGGSTPVEGIGGGAGFPGPAAPGAPTPGPPELLPVVPVGEPGGNPSGGPPTFALHAATTPAGIRAAISRDDRHSF